MSTKSAVTKKKKAAPRQGTVAYNSNRIDEMENLLKDIEVTEEILPVMREIPKKYLATGRVSFPTIGGLALPSGVGFHAYVETEFEDIEDAAGKLHAPSREDVTARLKTLADEKHPLNTGIALCDISTLPAGW